MPTVNGSADAHRSVGGKSTKKGKMGKASPLDGVHAHAHVSICGAD